MDLRFALLLVCFFVSGFAALLYQTAWTREFAFLFGTSELAVVAVLAAYMGGLALGAAAAARVVDRLTRPVLAYGLLELGIAIGAFCVPFQIRAVQAVYIALAGGLDAPPESMALTTALFHLLGSFAVLVPCTALMGATLPLLARYAVSEDAQVGPRIGVLYAVNTFGAIAGTLVAAFHFLPQFGLRQTVAIGIAGNAIVFLAAAALARGIAGMPPEAERAGARSAPGFHWILPAMTLSGAVSFLYEVLWTRLLGHVLGGSTAAFASMLASFLLGIALGSALAARFATSRAAAARGFALAQLGSGVLAWIAFRAADLLPGLALAVGANPTAPASGAAAAGVMLLPVTLCIGATFPFGVRLLARDADDAAAVSGRVYAWNTLGSIVGAVLTGFFLLPLLGLENTALVGVVTSLALAVFAAAVAVPRRGALAGVAAVGLLAALVIGLPRPTGLLMHSAISGERMAGKLFYLGVGRSATVTVVEHVNGWKLLTNGLPESGVDREELPNLRTNETAWLSLLPTLARPETREMLIIGLGGGKTLEATASTVASIDVIELEEEVVVANRLMPRPSDPLADPRVSLRLGDARGAMQLSEKRYDAIVSQPSHPWTSGASHLYTREFFELVESKLADGGIFIQWIGAGFVDVPLFGSLMASMSDVFEHVHVYRPVPAALVFMASNETIDLRESAPRALEAARSDFAIHGIHRVEDLYASWTLDTAGVRALSQGRPLNTDDHNRLATTRLPPEEGRGNREGFEASLEPVEPLNAERLAGLQAEAVLRRMSWNGENARAQRVAQGLPEAAALAAQGWLAYDARRDRTATGLFRRASEADPTNDAARAGLVQTRSRDVIEELGLELDEAERAILASFDALERSDWASLRALDESLAAIAPGHLLFPQAARARTLWRVEIGSAGDGTEAIEIVDGLLTRQRTPSHYLLRARAAALAGQEKLAWAALDQIANRRRIGPQLAERSLALAQELGSPPEGSTTIEQLTQALRRRR
jgi:spermidine synthase